MPRAHHSEGRTVTFKLFMIHKPRIKVTYKNKYELFSTFKKKMKELGIPSGTKFWIDNGNHSMRISGPDEIMDAARDKATLCLSAVTNVSDDGVLSCSSCDEFAVDWRRSRREVARRHSPIHRSRSRSCSRGSRSRSRDRLRNREHFRTRRFHSSHLHQDRDHSKGRHFQSKDVPRSHEQPHGRHRRYNHLPGHSRETYPFDRNAMSVMGPPCSCFSYGYNYGFHRAGNRRDLHT